MQLTVNKESVIPSQDSGMLSEVFCWRETGSGNIHSVSFALEKNPQNQKCTKNRIQQINMSTELKTA